MGRLERSISQSFVRFKDFSCKMALSVTRTTRQERTRARAREKNRVFKLPEEVTRKKKSHRMHARGLRGFLYR